MRFNPQLKTPAKSFMRLLCYLITVAAGGVLLFRVPQLPQAWHNLTLNDGHKQYLAAADLCVNVVLFGIVLLCMKKSLARPKAE